MITSIGKLASFTPSRTFRDLLSETVSGSFIFLNMSLTELDLLRLLISSSMPIGILKITTKKTESFV